MTSFLFRAGTGTAGDISKQVNLNVETGFLNPNFVPAAFGLPVKIVNGKFEAIQTGDTDTDFYGILTRQAPGIGGALDNSFGDGTPNPATAQGIMVEGYALVVCGEGTPVRGNNVYMRVVAAPGLEVGDLEADEDVGNNVLLNNVVFSVDGKDANNITEIRIKN